MLHRQTLEDGLAKLFSESPDNAPECGRRWAAIVREYFTLLVPPSVNVTPGEAGLAQQLGSAFAAEDSFAALEQAFQTYAVQLGTGMTPYVATPPPGLIGFARLSRNQYESVREAAAAMADAIHAWALTGIAYLPPAAAQTWS